MSNYQLYHCSSHYLWLQYSSLEEAAKAKDILESLYGKGNVEIKTTISQEQIEHELNVKRCIAGFEKSYGPLDSPDEDLDEPHPLYEETPAGVTPEIPPLELAKALRDGKALIENEYKLTFENGKFVERNYIWTDSGHVRQDLDWKVVLRELRLGYWQLEK